MQLIPNVKKQWWRLWSVRLQAVGTALVSAAVTAYVTNPDEINAVVLSNVPAEYLAMTGIALNVVGIAARFIKQTSLEKDSENGND